MSLGLLFSGQGTQHAAMLPWLEDGADASTALALLTGRLGADWRAQLDDPAWSTRNDIAQPLLTGVCLAAWEQLAPLLPAPRVIAGYSVGELAAFSAAGVFDTAAAMALAAERARIMDDCVRDVHTGLLSVTGAAPMAIARLCEQHGLTVAIRTGADRAILGGVDEALLAAERDATASGTSCQRLAVALASHTPWLEAGVEPLAAVIEAMPFRAPHTALVCNLTGSTVLGEAGLREALSRQIAATVQWDRCMDTVAERGVRCVLEIGPGSALARLWNSRHASIPARSLDEFQHARGAARWVATTLATE